MRIGDQVKLSPEAVRALKPIQDEINAARSAYAEAASWLHNQRLELWRVIHELHPELVPYHLFYDRETQTITVSRKRHEVDGLKEPRDF